MNTCDNIITKSDDLNYLNKPIKIAVCYAGQKRSWDKCFSNHLQNLLDERCTIFSCTDQPLDNISPARSIIIHDDLSLYQDVYMTFSNRKRPETKIFNGLKMYYSIYKSVQLKKEYEVENNMKFDVVIRIRPDIMFHNNYKDHINIVGLNSIVSPNDKDYGGLCDQFWFSNSQEADDVASLYLKIGEYFVNQGITFHPETFLYHHCQQLKFDIIRTDIKFDIII